MAVNDIFKVSNLFTAPAAAGEMVMTFHYRQTVAGGQPTPQLEAQELAQEMVSQIETHYLTILPNVIQYERADVIGITDPSVQGTWASGSTGVDVDQPVSFRNAPVVSLKSGLRGRQYNGRSFGLPMSESQQDGGTIINTYITSLATLYTNLLTLTRPNLDAFELGVYSRQYGLFSPVTTFIVRPNLGTQKSRQNVSG